MLRLLPNQYKPLSALYCSIEQNFALITFFYGCLHFQWVSPVPALILLTISGYLIYTGSLWSKLTAAVFSAVSISLHFSGFLEMSYFVMGIHLPVSVMLNIVLYRDFVVARRSYKLVIPFLFTVILYPGSFYVLHEPGLMVPAFLSPSGIIYLPYLPFYYVLLIDQERLVSVLKWLNW